MKFSVILPVYNAEKTLGRCLDSLVGQEFRDYEILLINDGSRDGSGTICQTYATKYPQIRYFSQKNRGVSAARNLGLGEAGGDYLLFVDSDDYVEPTYFSALSRAVEAHRPDLLLFGARSVGGAAAAWNTGSFFENTEQKVAQRITDAMQRYLFSSLCNKCFRRTLIERDGQRFETGLATGEDQSFIFSFAMKISTLESAADLLYDVDVSDGDSLSRKSRPYLTEQLIQCSGRMYDAFRKADHTPEAAALYEQALSWAYYRSAYSCIKEQQKLEQDGRQRRKNIRSICRIYGEKKIRPRGWKCHLIALPIRLRMAGALDRLARHR